LTTEYFAENCEDLLVFAAEADLIIGWEMPEDAKEGAKLIRPCDMQEVAALLG